MSENLKKCFPKLQTISAIKNEKMRKKVLQDLCDDCIYKALHEVAVNLFNKNIKLSNAQKQKLRKNKGLLMKLSKKTFNKKERKKLVSQSGGFLPIIVPTLAAILTSLIK